MIRKVKTVRGIKNAYSKRILGNLIGKDPMSVFAKTPGDLKRLTSGLTRRQLQTPPGKGRWSITQLISHLCDAEWAMGFRIRKAIAESTSPLQAYDQDLWAANLHYDQMDFKAKLNLFRALRQSHVSLLNVLSSEELQRYGIHSERGKETVERMIHMLAGHDVNHLKQIEGIRNTLLGKDN